MKTGARAPLVAVGENADRRPSSVEELRAHWQQAFAPAPADGDALRRRRPFVRRLSVEVKWRRTRQELSRRAPTAPGPDGIPYSADTMVRDLVSSVLLAVYKVYGRGVPADWNVGAMVFLAKVAEPVAGRVAAPSEADTRPLTLGNMAGSRSCKN